MCDSSDEEVHYEDSFDDGVDTGNSPVRLSPPSNQTALHGEGDNPTRNSSSNEIDGPLRRSIPDKMIKSVNELREGGDIRDTTDMESTDVSVGDVPQQPEIATVPYTRLCRP